MFVFHCSKLATVFRDVPKLDLELSPKNAMLSSCGCSSKNESANISSSETGIAIFLIGIRVVAKFAGSEDPVFTSMGALLHGTLFLKRTILKKKKAINYCSMGSPGPPSRDTIPFKGFFLSVHFCCKNLWPRTKSDSYPVRSSSIGGRTRLYFIRFNTL
jgi:hypothetical protein